ncbi:hypothetical protein JCM11641_004435, partial [Rhodosporidiobolus odoratus]
MPPTLPTELVDHIFEYLVNDWSAREQDIARCCLVSSNFLELARPRLYCCLRVRLGPATETQLYRHDYATSHMLHVILTQIRLASLVRELQVGGEFYSAFVAVPFTYLRLEDTLQQVFTLCPGITKLSVHSTFLAQIFSSSAATLTRLTLDCDSTNYPDLAEFPNLRYLHCKVAWLEKKQASLAALPSLVYKLTQVDTFAISAPGIFTLSNIRALTSSSPDSLPANLPPTLVAL